MNLTPRNPGDADSDWSSRPFWPKHGQEIFFTSFRPISGLDTEIFVMNADGTGLTRLTNFNRDGRQSARAIMPHGLDVADELQSCPQAGGMVPFISIVIATRNRPRQLARCLEACSRLDYPRERFEVIVVDDGSTVSLECVVTEYRHRMNLQFLRQPNTGPAQARNVGIAMATGELLAFTDDDCMPETDWLSQLASALQRTPGHMIGGRTVNALTANAYSTTSQVIVDAVYRHYNAGAGDSWFFASNNLAVPAATLREIGGFNNEFRFAEDRELCDRWQASGFGLSYAPDAVVQHAHDLTARTFWRQHFGYGRGAQHYHAQRARRQPDAGLDMSFHANLRNWIGYPLSQVPRRQAVQVAALLMVWQVANAAGFFYEAARTAFGRRRWQLRSR